ncbi:MAG: hypothetical protein RLN96_06995 [Pseudomonadales bacterium]
MKSLKSLVPVIIFASIAACGSVPTATEGNEMECAGLERTERERCLEFHDGSYDQYRREQMEKQQSSQNL